MEENKKVEDDEERKKIKRMDATSSLSDDPKII
jgi:hypothetical protein